jgi:hypothetical protein
MLLPRADQPSTGRARTAAECGVAGTDSFIGSRRTKTSPFELVLK